MAKYRNLTREEACKRRHHALELREKGLTLKEVGKRIRNVHTGELGVSTERARSLVFLANRDKEWEKKSLEHTVHENPMDYLRIPVRVYNALRHADLYDLDKLKQANTTYMLKLRNFGRVSLRHLNQALIDAGYEPIREGGKCNLPYPYRRFGARDLATFKLDNLKNYYPGVVREEEHKWLRKDLREKE